MKKMKCVLTGFAIFAAAIMLLNPCMARPVAEKTTMNAVEKNAEDINAIMQSISNDRAVMQSMRLIEQSENEEEFVACLEQFGLSLQNNPGFTQLENLIIAATENGLSGESEWAGYLQNMDGEILIPGLGWISPGGDLDGGQAQWAGFLRNMGGDIYVPDVGWISPDDPDYATWLAIEDALQESGLSLLDITAILCMICALIAVVSYILVLVLSFLGCYDAAGLLAYLFIIAYYGAFFFWILNDIFD